MSHLVYPLSVALCAAWLAWACTAAGDCPESPATPPCTGCIATTTASGCSDWLCPVGCPYGAAQDDAASPDGDGSDTGAPTDGELCTPLVRPPMTAPPERALRYVRIDDVTSHEGFANVGVRIDAMTLESPDGSFFASTTEGYAHANCESGDVHIDPEDAVGKPDVVEESGGAVVCSTDTGYVELGGTCGHLIVGMDADIHPGDVIVVYDAAGCLRGPDSVFEVSVSDERSLDSPWLVLGRARGPVARFVVPALPGAP